MKSLNFQTAIRRVFSQRNSKSIRLILLGLAIGIAGAGLLARHVRPAIAREGVRLIRIADEPAGATALATHGPAASLAIAGGGGMELMDGSGARTPFSRLDGAGRMLAIRESAGGFVAGEFFAGTQAAGAVARVSPDGRQVREAWAVLPGETGLVSGLCADVSNGELIAVTTRGGVWRMDAEGKARRATTIVTRLAEGEPSPVAFDDAAAAPADPAKYGPWAGRTLALAGGTVYAIDAGGAVESFDLGLTRGANLLLIPANENFFGLVRESAEGAALVGARASDFASFAGDFLIADSGGGRPALWRVHWDGASFRKDRLAEWRGASEPDEWAQAAFSPFGGELLQQQGAIPLVGPVGRPAAAGADDLTRQEAFIPTANGVTAVAFTVSDSQALRFINTLFNSGDTAGVFVVSAPTIPAGFTVTASGDSGATFVSLNNGGSVRTNTPVNPRNEERNLDIRIGVPAGTPVDRDYDLVLQVTSATDATKFDRTTDRLRISAGAIVQPPAAPLTLTKTVRDLNGGLVQAGDLLEYTLTQTNNSNAPINRTFIAEFIPPGVTYLADSVRITAGANQGAKTDRAGDDQVEYLPIMAPGIPNGQINILTGAGASAAQGGTLGPNESNTAVFQVRVNTGLANGLTIVNGANCGANGQYPVPGCVGSASSRVSASAPLVGPFARADAVGPADNNNDFTLRRVNLGSANNLTTSAGQVQFINTLRNAGETASRFVVSVQSLPPMPAGFSVVASADSGTTFVPLTPSGTVVTPTDVQPFATQPGDAERNLDVRVSVPVGLTINTDYDVVIQVCRQDAPAICNRTIDRIRPDTNPPNLALVKAVRDLNGADLNGKTAAPGQTIEYSLTLTNQSSSPVANAAIADYLPPNVTYVAGSARIVTGPNAGAKTDARGDDQVDYFASAPPNPNGQLNFYLGAGAASLKGGTLAPNESTSVAFRVRINDNAPQPSTIRNGADWAAEDFGIGGKSNIVETTVNSAPCTPAAIATQPADRQVCNGTSVRFTTAATGSDLRYQWRKDGVNIPGATAAEYVIVQVTPADVAKYDVVISNACSTLTSNAAQLRIAPAPAITTQPLSQTKFEGQSVTFTVAATPAPGETLAYQWRKNGVNIPGATGASYTIAAVAVGDAGSYDVVVTGGCGNLTSAAAALTVTQCPAITVNPAASRLPDASTNVAYSQTFTATGGVAPITFSVVGALPAGLSLNSMSGAVTGTPTATANATFSIRATDANGCTGSREYSLAVIQCVAPVITVQPADRQVCGGTSAFFNVTATGTNLSYQWRKDGVNIPGATASQFVIVQVTAADLARYDVVVSNACGMATSNAARLTITPSPAITTQPASATRFEGASVTFSVTATNAASYQWRKNGVNIPGATGSSYTIAAVAAGDAGNYDVVVSSGCEAITSAVATLTVTQCPAITIAPAANALPPAVVGTGYSQTFTASGGVAPVTLSLGGTLPGGLSFNPSNGLLLGTPTATGAFAFSITARDANGCARTQNYVLAVGLTPASTDACRLTLCFRSANYFSLNWGTNNIPAGAVLVDGVNFASPILSTDPRVKLALDGQFGALNREWVAAQLNILGASGMGAANVQTALWSELRCYGLDFDPVVLAGNPQPLTRNTTLFDLVQRLNASVKDGLRGRDACILTRILNGLNGDSSRNVCHRATAKLDFTGCN
jgi:uncharacterized repeat protein (TIGR01451 family)